MAKALGDQRIAQYMLSVRQSVAFPSLLLPLMCVSKRRAAGLLHCSDSRESTTRFGRTGGQRGGWTTHLFLPLCLGMLLRAPVPGHAPQCPPAVTDGAGQRSGTAKHSPNSKSGTSDGQQSTQAEAEKRTHTTRRRRKGGRREIGAAIGRGGRTEQCDRSGC
jgi:hypothetical protein